MKKAATSGHPRAAPSLSSEEEKRPIKQALIETHVDHAAEQSRVKRHIKIKRYPEYEDLTTTTDHRRAAPPSPSSEEKRRPTKQARIETHVDPAAEQSRVKRRIKIKRYPEYEDLTRTTTDHRAAAPSPSSEEKRHIKRVARFVARDSDGDLTEKLLLRLLSITHNRRRWGFLAPDHPFHPYYFKYKLYESCRLLRPEPAAAADR